MPYNALKIFLLSLFIVYFFAGFYVSKTIRGEKYLIFPAFLFTQVPPQIGTEYTVRILEYGGKELDHPILFPDAYKLYFDNSIALPHYNSVIRYIGINIWQGQSGEIGHYIEALERSFLSKPVVYEIVRVKFDTIEYWRTGKTIEEKGIATFNTEDAGL